MMSAAIRSAVTLERVTKRFGNLVAVNDVTLDIPGGEFYSLAGPSGCGKTTILRMIAGLEEPTAGCILLEDSDVSFVLPTQRNVNMVFQACGLFPHMTVNETLAFALKIRHVSRTEIAERVADALRTVRIEDLGNRRPAQRSGGRQQLRHGRRSGRQRGSGRVLARVSSRDCE